MLARLPGRLDGAPLAERSAPYLKLPAQLDRDENARDRDYRALLPAGATTHEGLPFKGICLRRAAHRALMRRAEFEAHQLRAAGCHDRARRWEADMSAAEEAYHDEVRARRSMFWDRNRRSGDTGAGLTAPFWDRKRRSLGAPSAGLASSAAGAPPARMEPERMFHMAARRAALGGNRGRSSSSSSSSSCRSSSAASRRKLSWAAHREDMDLAIAMSLSLGVGRPVIDLTLE